MMTLDGYFRVSSYALLATSFVMLAATGQLDWLSVALFTAVLAVGWLVDSGRLRFRIPKRLITGLMVGYLPMALLDWWLVGSMPVIVLVHFIFFASSFKLLQPKLNRDWLWLYVVAFFEMLLAAGMTIDTTFLLLLIAFLFAAISTMASFEVRRGQQAFAAHAPAVVFRREPAKARWRNDQPRLRSLAGFSAAALTLILLLAVPLFLAMPRLSRGFLGEGLLRGESLSGFSDSVRLGEVAQVKLNPQVVMRVRVEQSPEQYRAALRWRGVTFDYYDGRSWNDSTQRDPTYRLSPVRRSNEDEFQLREIPERRQLTKQTFMLEPLDIPTVFVAPEPVLVRNVRSLRRDTGDGLWTSNHSYYRLNYTVYSDTREVRDSELRADNSRFYRHDVSQRYLQLPENRDRRIDELAAEVTRGATTQIEVARRIETHLRTSYGYTLNLRRTDDGDPVADFLFNLREGHCEYFATAMALMLRSRGVPSRLVNGFQMGEYNDVDDIYTVRQSDAHSWVEAYFPQHGWVAFDPTPPAGLNVYEGGLMAHLRHYGEAMELFWQEHVVGFNSAEQASIVFAAQRWLTSYQSDAASRWFDWKFSLARWVESWRRDQGGEPSDLWSGDSLRSLALHPLGLALYSLVGLGGAAFIWHKRGRSWRRRIKKDATGSAVAFYQEMLEALERTGHKRGPDQTPLEFAAALGRPGVEQITDFYQRVRFGGGHLTEAEIEQLGRLLRELKRPKNHSIRPGFRNGAVRGA